MNNVSSSSQSVKPYLNLVVLAILLNLFFLSYLAWTSQIIIFHDSIGYENIAKMFANGQWKEYFVTGPSREPLYSLLIAFSMRIAQWQNMDYLAVQIMLQVMILMASQFLTYKILKKLHISDGICALTLAYMGISPAFASSGLILFSEIITYPILLCFILALSNAWTQLNSAPLKKNIYNGLLLAGPALLITFTKAAFELIVPILLITFFWKGYQAYKTNNQKIFFNTLILLAVAVCAFELPIIFYKFVNKHYNGVYALTDRGPEALYGNTVRRMQPLSSERIKTVLAYMTGADVCSRLYQDRCLHWGFLTSDIIGADKMAALRAQGLTRENRNNICIKESIQTVLKNPVQYFALTFVEALKVIFWEDPEIPYTAYSDGIDKIYNNPWVRYPLRFVMAFACGCALLFSALRTWANRKNIFDLDQPSDERSSTGFLIFLTIIIFAGVHSTFLILPRYALPVAPLFLVLVAWQFDIVAKSRKART